MTVPATYLCAAPGCPREPSAGRLCIGHAAKLGQWIADIENLYATLDAGLSQGTDWSSTGHAGLASTRSPARLDVLVLRDGRSRERDQEDGDGNTGRGVLEVLESWARLVREQRSIDTPTHRLRYERRARPAGPIHIHEHCGHDTCQAWTFWLTVTPPATVSSERNLLATQFDWITTQDWVDELYADIGQVHALLRSAQPQGVARRAKIGDCPECGGRLIAGDYGDVSCWDCGHAYEPSQLRELGETLLREGYVEIFRAEWLTEVPASTIRRWIAAGRITSQMRGGKRLVNVGEIQDIRPKRAEMAS